MKSSEVLTKALELLGPNGELWCKSLPGVEWPVAGNCASTACGMADTPEGYQSWKARTYLARAIGIPALETHSQIHGWNDAPERTFPEVRAAFEKAIELAKSEESSNA